MSGSRRAFLKQASSAAAAGLLMQIQGRQLWAATPADLIPEPDEALMREAALMAMEATRSAGASFADIRLNVARAVSARASYVHGGDWPFKPWPLIALGTGYGIRAIVDGAWGFAHGSLLTPDAVAETARAAVALARLNRPRRPRALELAPTSPVEQGIWETPIERDPFSVSLREQRDLMDAALSPLASLPKVDVGKLEIQWRRMTTGFASTDGTLVIQRLCTAVLGGEVHAYADRGSYNRGAESVRTIRVGPYGYEGLGPETIVAGVRDAAERAIARAEAARTPVAAEVGRYDLVFAPEAVANLLATTVAEAVNLQRALGYHANGVGTSFAAPPADMLGRYQIASTLITVHGDRTQPKGAATVGWDEEGVKPEAYTFIKDGVIVDYHADRQMAMELAGWYHSRGVPVKAHGIARRTGTNLPVPRLPNLTMEPGQGRTTVEDLIAGTKRGYYVETCGGAADQQVLNTQCGAPHAAVRRITNGKLGSYVKDFAFQFITPQFWKSVDGVGGRGTAESIVMTTDERGGDSSQPFPYSTVRTVPMRARDVNVLNIGRTA